MGRALKKNMNVGRKVPNNFKVDIWNCATTNK